MEDVNIETGCVYNPEFRVVYTIKNKSSPFGSPRGTFKTYKSQPGKLELLKMVVLQLPPTYKLLLSAADAVYIDFYRESQEEKDFPAYPDSNIRFDYSLGEIMEVLREARNE